VRRPTCRLWRGRCEWRRGLGWRCATPGPDEWHYVFEEASGDCPSGCIDHTYHHFVTLATGEVKRDGPFEYHHDAQRPEWFTQYVTKAVCH